MNYNQNITKKVRFGWQLLAKAANLMTEVLTLTIPKALIQYSVTSNQNYRIHVDVPFQEPKHNNKIEFEINLD